jgi:hypothetical protein
MGVGAGQVFEKYLSNRIFLVSYKKLKFHEKLDALVSYEKLFQVKLSFFF